MRAWRGNHEQGRVLSAQAVRDLLPWVPTLLGVLALIVLLIFAATRFTSGPEPTPMAPGRPFLPVPAVSPAEVPPTTAPTAPPVSSAAPTAPTAPTAPGTPPGRSKKPAVVPTSQRPAPGSRGAADAPAPAAPGPVSGRYRVLESFDDAFIGEVLVVNSSGRDSNWRVELRFPAAVGELFTSWVESAPQATLRRSGDSYIWSSGVPVPARGQVPLRFHFSRTGSGNLPSRCTVNGSACAGVR